MNKQEAKNLQVGDKIEFSFRNGHILLEGEVISNSTSTIFGTPILRVVSEVQSYNALTGRNLGPVLRKVFDIKPKDIVRKV